VNTTKTYEQSWMEATAVINDLEVKLGVEKKKTALAKESAEAWKRTVIEAMLMISSMGWHAKPSKMSVERYQLAAQKAVALESAEAWNQTVIEVMLMISSIGRHAKPSNMSVERYQLAAQKAVAATQLSHNADEA